MNPRSDLCRGLGFMIFGTGSIFILVMLAIYQPEINWKPFWIAMSVAIISCGLGGWYIENVDRYLKDLSRSGVHIYHPPGREDSGEAIAYQPVEDMGLCPKCADTDPNCPCCLNGDELGDIVEANNKR